MSAFFQSLPQAAVELLNAGPMGAILLVGGVWAFLILLVVIGNGIYRAFPRFCPKCKHLSLKVVWQYFDGEVSGWTSNCKHCSYSDSTGRD